MRSRHVTLAADTVATIDLLDRMTEVELVYRADPAVGTGAPVYFTVNGATPTVAGDDTEVLAPGIGRTVTTQPGVSGPTKVRVISSAAVAVSIIGRGPQR
jgi:hypothetical protein